MLLNVWLFVLGFFTICFIIIVIIISTAPEFIEDKDGNLIPRKEYEKTKNLKKKKK